MRISSFLVLVLALALVTVLPPSRAQPIAYGHTIGDASWQSGYAIDTDASGDVYVLGQTALGNGSGDMNLFVAKFDSAGVALWQRQLNFSALMYPIDLVTDPTGNVYVDAIASPSTAPDYGVLVRFAANGSLGFAEQFPMTPNGLAWNPVTGNVVVTGDGAGGYGNGFVASFSPDGGLRWMRSVPTAESASAWGVTVSSGGNIYFTADRPALSQSSLVAFDGNGTLLAERRLNGLGSPSYTWDAGVSPGGTVFFLGEDWGRGVSIIAGFNATLSPQWSEYVNASFLSQSFYRVAAHPDGTLYAVGSYYNYSNYAQGSVVLHVSENGSLIKDESYDSYAATGSFRFHDAALQTDGSLLLAGESYGSPARDEFTQGFTTLPRTPGSWVVDNVTWTGNTTTPASASMHVFDPGFAVDDFSPAASSQLWWGAIAAPAPSLNVTVAATVPPLGSGNRTVNFTSTVAGGSTPYTYRWSFGDGNFSNVADPVHTYGEGGVFPVQLWVNDSLGHRGYNYTQVQLWAPPDISYFNASPNVTYVYNWVYFYAAATDPNGGYITNYHWDFGDNSSVDTGYGNAYHWYSQTGTFTANLTVTESEGLTASETLQVRVLDQPPYACLQMYPNPAFVGQNVSYSSCSWDPDGYITWWSWNFGDGTTSSGANASSGAHVYNQAGTYQVTLNVTDNAGLWALANQWESVYVNLPPVASFTTRIYGSSNVTPVAPGPNQTIQFDGSSSYARNVGAYLAQWAWNFGDGTTVWQYYYPYAYHAYSVAGRTYRVSLTVYDSYGISNTTSKSLYVDVPPVAAITAPRSYAKVGTPFVVNGSTSSDADGSIRQWLWNFGDGGTGTGAVASHVYGATGEYNITLEVFDNNNLSTVTHLSVSVVEPKTPTAILSYSPSRPVVGIGVAFNATRSIDPDGAITGYTWQFGDGTVGTGVLVSHTYAAPGSYTVILTVVDEDSMTSTSTTTVQVVSRPVAAFVVYPSSPLAGDAVSFSAAGSSDLSGSLTFTWSFGDGSFGTGWQATHTYPQAGSYQVTLTVTNVYGMNATSTQTVVVASPGLGATAASSFAWLGLGLLVGAGAVALAVYLVNRRRKGGGAPPPPP